MALQLTIPKQQNYLYAEMTDAYWKLDTIRTELVDGEIMILFILNAYPSREASKATGEVQAFPIGRPTQVSYLPVLHEYTGLFKASQIFPEGIPVTVDAQKAAIYTFIKSSTQLPFEDVLEN